MATIVATSAKGTGAVAVTETTLDGTLDTFTYSASTDQVLTLRNDTAGALSPIIDGDGASTVNIQGAGSFDISAGYAVGSMAAGAVVTIKTKTIESFLKGTIEITGGTGLVASVCNY